jgi:hypothetical protein
MRKLLPFPLVACFIVVGVMIAGTSGAPQTSQAPPASAPLPPVTPRGELYTLEDAFLRWPLPATGQRYATLDGKRMHQDVGAQALISRRYRDQGHPKFWGRIIGTSADTESAEWLADKFRAAGLSDVRIQPFDLLPQWMPQTWDITVTVGGKTIKLESAQPAYRANPLPPGGIDVEAVYVGLGSETDFAGKDVKGKAVFVFNMLGIKPEGAVRRADAKGAAIVFEVDMLPGNMRYQAYPSGTKAPAFVVGSTEGYAVRDLMAAGLARVKATFDVQMAPNLKTSLVWGTLKGTTDETIVIMAHRDGWFDAAGDNASGVASMIALAEFYSKVAQSQRRRTIVFIGLDGHHNSGEGSNVGGNWLWENRDKLFANTALAINCEHPSTVITSVRPRYQNWNSDAIVWGNTYLPQQWYAGGPARRKLETIAVKAFQEFGASMWLDPNPRPPAGDLGRLSRYLPGVATSEFYHYFHTDQETPETVPWTGLEASTRAYARIIDEVNELPLSDLKRPEEPLPTPPTTAPASTPAAPKPPGAR